MRRMSSPSRSTSRPATWTEPLVFASSVVMIRMTVVFPAPFGPRKPKNSPSPTEKLTSLTALISSWPRPPYTFTKWRTSITEFFGERGIAAFFLLSGRSVATCDMAPSPSGCRLNSLASDTRDDVPLVKESVERCVTCRGRSKAWSDTPPSLRFKPNGDRLGMGNSHEVLLHRNPGARPRTLDRVLREGDGNEGHAAGADAPRRRVGRAEESRLGTETRAQLVSGREQVFHPISQRGGVGPPGVPSLRRRSRVQGNRRERRTPGGGAVP